jgi:predicted TIM-barrel fold metal-dependent hydrolase
MSDGTRVIDCDQHLYEAREMWRDHIDPDQRDDALAIVDDELGYPWLCWRGRRLELADVQHPGDTGSLGRHRTRARDGLPPEYSYDETLPADYWEPSARVARLDAMGLDEAVLFPNFGLLWERALSESLPALTANMGAWNRWCADVRAGGQRRLHPVAHVTLRDREWLEAQLAALGAADVRMAMIGAAPVDDRPLSHADHDRVWAMFVEHGVTPVFHVGEQQRAAADGWYTDEPDHFVSPLDSIMLSTAPAVAVTDLIVHGTLARHPDLRIGVIELGGMWVPGYLPMLDGGWEFTNRLNGGPVAALDARPSEYFRRQVRVAAFSYEQPDTLAARAGDLFMLCSDYPHSEGTNTPLRDYAARGLDADSAPAFARDNCAFLLGADEAPIVAPGVRSDAGWLATEEAQEAEETEERREAV